MKRLVIVLAIFLLAGCASKSADIAPSYVSPTAYTGLDCTQLSSEARIVSQRAAVASGRQDKARNSDVLKTTVGLVLFWPALLFNEGDGAKSAEVASLKGQMQAIEQASLRQNCGIKFQQG